MAKPPRPRQLSGDIDRMADATTTIPSKALMFKLLAGIGASHDWAMIAFGDLLNRGDRIIDTKGQGNQDYYDLMVDSDALLAGIIDTRITSVAGLEWRVNPASDEPEGVDIAEFVGFVLDRLGDFDEKLSNILSACRTGFSVTEIMWDYVVFNGRQNIAPVELIPRRPERFRFDTDYQLRLLTKGNMLVGEEVPTGKFLVHSFKPRYNNPYGTSLCRAVWWYWWFKHHAFKWWLQAAERGAVVSPILWYPEHSNESEIKVYEQAAKTFLGNKYLTLPEGGTADFPHIKIDPNFCKNLVETCDMQMRVAILGSTLSTGTAESGTRALGQVHDKRGQERIEADAKSVMSTINQQLVRWIVDLNYGEQEKYPEWALNYETPKDQKEMRENIRLAANMGIPISVKWAAGVMQIEIAHEGEDLIIPPPLPGSGGMSIPLDETEEPEEEEEAEEVPSEEAAHRIGYKTVKARKAAQKRNAKYRDNAEELTKQAAIKGYPIYQDIGKQVADWVATKDTLDDALNDLRYLRIDGSEFADYLLDAQYLALLRGFHDVFDVARDKGLFKAIKEGAYSKAKRKIYRTLYGADPDQLWIPVPPEEAIEHFEKKEILTPAQFKKLEAHVRRDSLTAADMSIKAIRNKLKPALVAAIAEGETLREFTKEVGGIVQSKAHAENIFRTNIQTSYNAGHAEAIWSPELKQIIPAFEYQAVMDDRTTPICAERDGQVYPRAALGSADVVPPAHFQCRSSIIEVWIDEWDGRYSSLPVTPAQEGFGRWKPALSGTRAVA